MLPGSHKIGEVREHHFSLGAGGLAVDESELAGRWLSANYEAGDALIFPSLTVHQALPNYTDDRLRISLDNRYQARDEPIARHMLEPHLTGVTGFNWETCYAGLAKRSIAVLLAGSRPRGSAAGVPLGGSRVCRGPVLSAGRRRAGLVPIAAHCAARS